MLKIMGKKMFTILLSKKCVYLNLWMQITRPDLSLPMVYLTFCWFYHAEAKLRDILQEKSVSHMTRQSDIIS